MKEDYPFLEKVFDVLCGNMEEMDRIEFLERYTIEWDGYENTINFYESEDCPGSEPVRRICLMETIKNETP